MTCPGGRPFLLTALALSAAACAPSSGAPDAEAPDAGYASPESWAMDARGTYTQHCAACHGEWGEGSARGASLIDDEWAHGGSNDEIARSIREGVPGTAMIPFGEALDETQIRQLVGLLRMSAGFAAYRNPPPVRDPEGEVFESERQRFRVEVVARDLWIPWGIEFLPDGALLVSDREGQLRVLPPGVQTAEPVAGTPEPWVVQDGGFFDVAVHPDHAANGWIYLAFSEPGPDNASNREEGPENTSMTKIVRGRIREGRWVDEEVLFQADPGLYEAKNVHYGSRFLFDGAGRLLYSIGDRGRKALAQDLSSPLGKIHRIGDDGSVPDDNPFAGRAGALGTVWSRGHRNNQGLAFDPRTGLLWASEHGPIGGDELNLIEPGRNYGWPVHSEGIEPGATAEPQDGMELPVAHWSPSIAPSSIHFYGGDRYPGWTHDLFVACLGGRHLRRIEIEGRRVVHQERLIDGYGRFRDVTTGPDGLLYLALERREGRESTRPLGLVLRLVPEE